MNDFGKAGEYAPAGCCKRVPHSQAAAFNIQFAAVDAAKRGASTEFFATELFRFPGF